MDELPTPSRTSPSGVSLRGVSPAANRVPDVPRMWAPFDSPILITGAYGGYDFGSAELVEAEDELHYGTDWKDDYPDMTRNEAVLQKSLEGILWDEWKDADGLLWCEVNGCIEEYLETLPESELDVINNN